MGKVYNALIFLKKRQGEGLGAIWGIGNWVRLKLGFQKFVAENCV